MAKSPDPTKDAEFQSVVQHFLKTPPKPFTPKAKGMASPPPAATRAEQSVDKRAYKGVSKSVKRKR